jgi:ABC-type lipoprotein release transport system permease subunit
MLSDYLFGIEARDPLSYGAVASLVLLVCLAASYAPARRVARVTPIEVLREEWSAGLFLDLP